MTKLIETKSIILFLLFSTLMGQDKGQKLFEQGKYDEARKYYESILWNPLSLLISLDLSSRFHFKETTFVHVPSRIAMLSLALSLLEQPIPRLCLI